MKEKQSIKKHEKYSLKLQLSFGYFVQLIIHNTKTEIRRTCFYVTFICLPFWYIDSPSEV